MMCIAPEQQKKDKLDAAVNKRCEEQTLLQKRAEQWSKFTSGLLANPGMLAMGKSSVFSLGQQIGMDASSEAADVMANLAVEIAIEDGKLRRDHDPENVEEWLQQEVEIAQVLKVAFFLQKNCENDLSKAKTVLEKSRKKFDSTRKSQVTSHTRKEKTLKNMLQQVEQDKVEHERDLSKRNVRNRLRKKIKDEKLRKKRSHDGEFKDVDPKVKRMPRLTIFQKLQVIDFAEEVIAEAKSNSRSSRKKTRKTKKLRGNFIRGMHLQRVCEQKFPQVGKIKISQLLKQAQEQSWRSLSVAQQKQYCQLPDSLKVAMGFTDKCKGWKAVGTEKFQELAREKGYVNRWKVPGLVMQDWLLSYVIKCYI